jgi:peroxiredoxin
MKGKTKGAIIFLLGIVLGVALGGFGTAMLWSRFFNEYCAQQVASLANTALAISQGDAEDLEKDIAQTLPDSVLTLDHMHVKSNDAMFAYRNVKNFYEMNNLPIPENIAGILAKVPPNPLFVCKLAVGTSAPAFNLEPVLKSGTNHLSLDDFKGKVVLLEFWGKWCPKCVKKLPKVQQLFDNYHDKGLAVVGVHSLKESEHLAEFVREHNITYPVAVSSEQMQDDYGIKGWPTYYIIDKEGKVVYAKAGMPPDNAKIEELLQKSDR